MNTVFYNSNARCVACSSSQFIQFYKLSNRVILSNRQFLNFEQNLECCYLCGLVRQENNESYSDANLNNYYSQTFRTPIVLESLKKNDKRVHNAKKRLEFIAKLKSKGSLLEVGFGDGVFLSLASEKYLCTGLDPSLNYKYLYSHLERKGITVSGKPLEEYSAKKTFDIVCSFLVLEHIKNPLDFIQLQLKHLTANGVLIIEIPDIRKYSSFNSDSVMTFEHVYHYCIESLTNMLARLNLKLVANKNTGISYGFSLIAAFKKSRRPVPFINISGFSVLGLFQGFFKKREEYKAKMTFALKSIFKRAEIKKRSIAIFGAGNLLKYAVNNCELAMNTVSILFDDTKEKSGMILFDTQVKPLSELNKYRPDIIIVFSEMFFDLIKDNIMRIVDYRRIEIIDIHKLSTGKYDK